MIFRHLSRVGAFLAIFVALGTSATAFCDGENAGGNGSRVKGKITFSGPVPRTIILPMGSDPKCQEQHPKGFRFQPVAVDAKGGLADVFVYVKNGLEGRKFAPHKYEVILNQKGCWYYPRVVGAMIGQKINVLNSDLTMHNVNALPEFNVAMAAGSKPIEKIFTKPAVMQKLKCNVHPWMTAYIGVVEHPYYAVTDKGGAYEIYGLPAGKYVLEAWHERLGTAAQEITVRKTGVTKADFVFNGNKEEKP